MQATSAHMICLPLCTAQTWSGSCRRRRRRPRFASTGPFRGNIAVHLYINVYHTAQSWVYDIFAHACTLTHIGNSQNWFWPGTSMYGARAKQLCACVCVCAHGVCGVVRAGAELHTELCMFECMVFVSTHENRRGREVRHYKYRPFGWAFLFLSTSLLWALAENVRVFSALR